MRDFSILMSWVNRFANSGANAPAAPLRKLSPRDPPPKNRPLLVDDWGGGGVWICAAVGARDWRKEYERCIYQPISLCQVNKSEYGDLGFIWRSESESELDAVEGLGFWLLGRGKVVGRWWWLVVMWSVCLIHAVMSYTRGTTQKKGGRASHIGPGLGAHTDDDVNKSPSRILRIWSALHWIKWLRHGYLRLDNLSISLAHHGKLSLRRLSLQS